ncbi:MAG: Asp-tRNA(Asn)/Glu-tRNA(Gln) amidotransferase subunit GatC [Desulfovibrionaceae bacterium]|nr:Asp-tRNA(Asn)/Glu-tRNA(Gln) amidotransferase subunit GatC [Desulfovibrionaceae bacterium]
MPQDKAAITREDVLHLAQLARLTVDEADVERFAIQLSDIVSYMDVLNSVDTTDVPPLYTPAEHVLQYREDAAAHVRTREQVLANAPEKTEDYFVVPRIV